MANPIHPLPILMYHYLGDPKDPDDAPYYVQRNDFVRQMRCLKWGGYRSISLERMMGAFVNGEKLPGRSVVITFKIPGTRYGFY